MDTYSLMEDIRWTRTMLVHHVGTRVVTTTIGAPITLEEKSVSIVEVNNGVTNRELIKSSEELKNGEVDWHASSPVEADFSDIVPKVL